MGYSAAMKPLPPVDFPPSMKLWMELLEILGEAGARAARDAARSTFRAVDRRLGGKRLPNYAALSAAADAAAADATPMWDAFAVALDQALKKPGARARLARHLGLPRQRVTDFTKGRRLPDAETTLRLLHWLVSTRAGHDPSLIVPPPEASTPPDGVTH